MKQHLTSIFDRNRTLRLDMETHHESQQKLQITIDKLRAQAATFQKEKGKISRKRIMFLSKSFIKCDPLDESDQLAPILIQPLFGN